MDGKSGVLVNNLAAAGCLQLAACSWLPAAGWAGRLEGGRRAHLDRAEGAAMNHAVLYGQGDDLALAQG